MSVLGRTLVRMEGSVWTRLTVISVDADLVLWEICVRLMWMTVSLGPAPTEVSYKIITSLQLPKFHKFTWDYPKLTAIVNSLPKVSNEVKCSFVKFYTFSGILPALVS